MRIIIVLFIFFVFAPPSQQNRFSDQKGSDPDSYNITNDLNVSSGVLQDKLLSSSHHNYMPTTIPNQPERFKRAPKPEPTPKRPKSKSKRRKSKSKRRKSKSKRRKSKPKRRKSKPKRRKSKPKRRKSTPKRPKSTPKRRNPINRRLVPAPAKLPRRGHPGSGKKRKPTLRKNRRNHSQPTTAVTRILSRFDYYGSGPDFYIVNDLKDSSGVLQDTSSSHENYMPEHFKRVPKPKPKPKRPKPKPKRRKQTPKGRIPSPKRLVPTPKRGNLAKKRRYQTPKRPKSTPKRRKKTPKCLNPINRRLVPAPAKPPRIGENSTPGSHIKSKLRKNRPNRYQRNITTRY